MKYSNKLYNVCVFFYLVCRCSSILLLLFNNSDHSIYFVRIRLSGKLQSGMKAYLFKSVWFEGKQIKVAISETQCAVLNITISRLDRIVLILMKHY